MTEPIVECVNLVKHFKIPRSTDVVQAVNDVSFAVAPGETVGLVGESGSGKTTIGRLILGLLDPTQGEVRFRGARISGLSFGEFLQYRPRVQAVFQDPYDSLDPRVRIRDAIIEPLVRMRLLASPAARLRRANEVAEMVGLSASLLDSYPHELSGGQQQRAGVARALISKPEFIVLDEPTSVLSPAARLELIRLLRELQRELKVAYLFITHDLKVVETLAHRVAVLYLGKIVELGKVEEIFGAPTHPYSQALLSSVLTTDPSQRGSVRLLKGEIPSPINLPAGCAFASRCPLADESCTRAVPPLDTVDGAGLVKQRVACFKAKESFVRLRPAGKADSAAAQ